MVSFTITERISKAGSTVQFLSLLHGARHPDTGQGRVAT